MRDKDGKKMTRMDYYMKNVAVNSGMNFPKKERKEPQVVSDTSDEEPDTFKRFMISNNSFMLGVANSANKSELSEDIQDVLKKAKGKISEKWVMTYDAAQTMFGRTKKMDNVETLNTKKTILRIYEVLKTYMHMFDVEKLMENYK